VYYINIPNIAKTQVLYRRWTTFTSSLTFESSTSSEKTRETRPARPDRRGDALASYSLSLPSLASPPLHHLRERSGRELNLYSAMAAPKRFEATDEPEPGSLLLHSEADRSRCYRRSLVKCSTIWLPVVPWPSYLYLCYSSVAKSVASPAQRIRSGYGSEINLYF